MLADMSTLASLAHAAAAPPAFYSTFFATVATVIPVLFIAIVLQSNAYQDLVGAGSVSQDNFHLYPLLVAGFILISGVGGESVAVYALYNQSIDIHTGGWVLAATIILILAAAAGPAVALWKSFGGGQPGGRGLLDPIPPETGGTVSPETDGTGTTGTTG